VRLQSLAESVAIEVEDNGVGFGGVQGRGMGLISMRERAELPRGSQCENRSTGGALVRLTIPAPAKGVSKETNG
jgi:signal transduction histidine kinase